jgi:hypothetical protein
MLQSCNNNDNPVNPPQPGPQTNVLEEQYMSIEDAVYHEGDLPAATIQSVLTGLSVNQRALQGGMNFITIVADNNYRRYFIGVRGVPGYFIYTPEEATTNTIPIMYSPELGTTITMLISGEDLNGNITLPYEAEVEFVDTESGELNINMTFSNAKDVDLHLYMPNGQHIFYGERGGTVEIDGVGTVSYGLDKDSNAGCNIDNLNNENIYIPAELIQAGEYTVVVDMYSNCNPSIETSWSIVARYKGELIPTATGTNPASGVYPVGAGNGDMTTVMKFTISDAAAARATSSRIKANSFVPTPLSDMDEMKLEEAKFRMEYGK